MKSSERFIQTYTGKVFDFDDPQPEQIDILDIAHALSNLCRFGGHTRWHYSVAQHSIYVSRLCGLGALAPVWPMDALYGLLHDAAEAYCVDVPRPIKNELTGYTEIEGRVHAAVYAKLGLYYD